MESAGSTAQGGAAAPWYLRKSCGRFAAEETPRSPRQVFTEALKRVVQDEGDADALAAIINSDRYSAHLSPLAMRYALQSQARAWATEHKDSLKRCHLWRIPQVMRDNLEDKWITPPDSVEVWRSIVPEGQKATAHYRGLESCKSVWKCPVCSARIVERRCEHLESLVQAHADAGGTLVHITYTVRHVAADTAFALVRCLRDAYRKLTASRRYKALAGSFLGTVRAQEVTYGVKNGWHPHYHVLCFVKPGIVVDPVRLQRTLHDLWKVYAARAGVGAPSREHGVKVRVAKSQLDLLADYVAKFNKASVGELWGAEAEMTRWINKSGDADRFQPFDFLRGGMIGDESLPWKELWQDYCRAFKSQAQLVYSKGLSKLYAVTEMTDQEAFDAPTDEQFALLARLHVDDWNAIVRTGSRGLLLHKVAVSGLDGLNACLSYVRQALALVDPHDPHRVYNHKGQLVEEYGERVTPPNGPNG